MSLNSKLSKTATSASLAILGVTQFNNKANASIVYNNSSITATGGNSAPWTLDNVASYGARFRLSVLSTGSSTTLVRIINTYHTARAQSAGFGSIVSANSVNPSQSILVLALNSGLNGLPNETGYIAFKDATGGRTPIYGWAKWTTTRSSNSVTINEWAYNSTPGASITVGQRSGTTDIPFDFNPLQGMALGVPIFIGLRQLKARKAKKNAIVSIKRKEKIHPLALLGMGVADVIKWREQKDKDAA